MLASTASTNKSLEAIRNKEAGLNKRRVSMLSRVPETGDWAAYKRNSIKNKDIAYLSAYTGDEFALLRGKNSDILFHGDAQHCNFGDELIELLLNKRVRLVAHTHPDFEEIFPSTDDRDFLKRIEQKDSVIVSSITGREKRFSANPFENM